MPAVSRTLGPLHFEDLEPHRFEDLVRQLVYDFRPWRRLEATGRAGSDDGFDARGSEITTDLAPSPEDTDEPEEDAEASTLADATDRIWLIQCKREKAISPAKLLKHLDALEVERPAPYGIIFVAPCDFSKKARDAFRAKVAELGFAEYQLWGKGELEDQLLQPKNDHLLFAYFGISLAIRRRSMRTEVRARLAMKRKAIRLLGTSQRMFRTVLIRDPEDERYPDPDPDKTKPDHLRRRWIVRHVVGHRFDGLRILNRRSFAFVGDDRRQWDAILDCNDTLERWENPWPETGEDLREIAREMWEALPPENRAIFESEAVIPYENIYDIDEHGDDICRHIQILTRFDPKSGPFRPYRYYQIKPSSGVDEEPIPADREARVTRFDVARLRPPGSAQP